MTKEEAWERFVAQTMTDAFKFAWKAGADSKRKALELALAELYRHATDTESGERAIAAVEGALNEDK